VCLELDSLIGGAGILPISRDAMLKRTLLGHTTAKSVENGELISSAGIVDAEGLQYQLSFGPNREFELTLYAFPFSSIHSPSQAPFKTDNQHPHYSNVLCTYLEL
jgi:hypothetical protein